MAHRAEQDHVMVGTFWNQDSELTIERIVEADAPLPLPNFAGGLRYAQPGLSRSKYYHFEGNYSCDYAGVRWLWKCRGGTLIEFCQGGQTMWLIAFLLPSNLVPDSTNAETATLNEGVLRGFIDSWVGNAVLDPNTGTVEYLNLRYVNVSIRPPAPDRNASAGTAIGDTWGRYLLNTGLGDATMWLPDFSTYGAIVFKRGPAAQIRVEPGRAPRSARARRAARAAFPLASAEAGFRPDWGSGAESAEGALGWGSESSESAFGSGAESSESAFGAGSESSESAFGSGSESSESAFGSGSESSESAFGAQNSPAQRARQAARRIQGRRRGSRKPRGEAVGEAFDHIIVIVMENQYRSYVMQNEYMQALAKRGINLKNSFGVMHPSQTNYIASIAGELCGVHSDEPIAPLLGQETIVDLIEKSPHGLRWGAYMESYDRAAEPWNPKLMPGDQFPYVVKHNPFGSFSRVVRDRDRWDCVGNLSDFYADLLNDRLPEFSWISPNMWSDGHYMDGTQQESDPRAPMLVDQLALWLENFLDSLRFPGPDNLLPPRTVVVVTFDEADFEAAYDEESASTYDGPNQVYTVVLGDGLEPRTEREAVNHYSLLRTIERNWGLGSLGKNDADSNWYRFLWGEHLRWFSGHPAPLRAGAERAAAGAAEVLVLVERMACGALSSRYTTRGSEWSASVDVGQSSGPGLACWSADGTALCADVEDNQMRVRRWSNTARAWGEPFGQPLRGEPVAGVAMPNGRDSMLVYRLEHELYCRILDGDNWGWPQLLPTTGQGGLTLSRLGASIYLIERERADGQLIVWSYNTAAFNVLDTHDDASDTTIFTWAPCAFPVTHFSSRPDPRTPGEPEPAAEAYQSREGMASIELDGCLHLLFVEPEQGRLCETRLSTGGLLTPKCPVSYEPGVPGVNDGFGTLAEAGWTKPVSIGDQREVRSSCAARVGSAVVVLTESGDGTMGLYWAAYWESSLRPASQSAEESAE